ncbi:FAD-dependent monooxygenase [Micromonospora sp. CA-240977]|uniref:FAD-dependent monooxygenase n=1 Tax=Micromonospora sp. CA-240977 TaxID=3239957 RepID=UPI003D8A2BCE
MTRSVVIAGGGPAGLLLAGELALAGVDVEVIERRNVPPERCDGMAVHARCLETLDLRGLAAPIRDHLFPWPRTPFSLLWLDLDAGSERDLTYGFPQVRLEAVLAARAEQLGARISRGAEVTAFAQDEDGVTVTVRSAGDERQVRASYLVGCDGPDSVVRTLAGITLDGSLPAYYGILGDVTLTDDLHELFDAGPRPGGLFGALPIEPGKIRLMSIEFDREPVRDAAPPTAAELAASLGRLTGRVPKIDETHYISRFGHATRLADRYRSGRVLVAGDAAHQLFISGTQGLNTAIQDVMNLGWKLAAVVNGWASEELLDTYEAERRPVGARMVRHAEATLTLLHPLTRLTALRELFSDLIGIPEVSRRLLRMPTEVRYPLGNDHPLMGTQVPPVDVHTAEAHRPLAELFHDGRGVLLLSDGVTGDTPARSDRVNVVTVERHPDLDADAVLLRPDGYVAYAGPVGGALDAALSRWFGAADRAAVGSPA